MNYPVIYVPARHCTVSDLNVRTQSDPDADAELEAMISETGYIIQNLIGVAVRRKKDHYSIFGGGRRLRQVHKLMDKGVLAEGFMVPVMVMSSIKDAIVLSFAENQKLPMSAADECLAYRNMVYKEGRSPAEVAKRFGKTERFVLGRMRLANLAEPIFEALRQGVITLDIAAAYGSTSDTARQASVFAQLEGSYYSDNVNEIRRMLAAGSYKGHDPKALFVGREAYEAAGGKIESDLFSTQETEDWIDADIVDRLAEEKLVAAAIALREREGFAEVRVVSALKVPYMETCHLDRLDGDPVPLSPEAVARKAEIETELAAIDEVAVEVGDYSEEQSDRVETLQEELETLTDTGTVLSDERRAAAIAYVVIGADGEPKLHEQLYSEPVEEETEHEESGATGHELSDAADGADESEDEEPETEGLKYSLRLLDELAMMKTELLAVHVANDPHFALDLGTFIMADNALRSFNGSMPSELRAHAPSPRVHGFESGTAAAEAWATFETELDRSWADHETLAERYDAFCALGDEACAAWLGWAIARTLQAVPDGAKGALFLDHLGGKLKIDVAAWWRPTARNFFDRITKPGILGLFETVGGPELKSRYAASRKFDLAVSAEKLFSGQVIIETEVKEKALAWLPDPMRFVSELSDTADDAAGRRSALAQAISLKAPEADIQEAA